MKRLYLISLLLFPMSLCAATTSDELDFVETVRKVDKHRVTSGVKAVAQCIFTYYAAKELFPIHGRKFMDAIQSNADNRWSERFKEGSLTIGIAYCGLLMLYKAYKNTRHALAV